MTAPLAPALVGPRLRLARALDADPVTRGLSVSRFGQAIQTLRYAGLIDLASFELTPAGRAAAGIEYQNPTRSQGEEPQGDAPDAPELRSECAAMDSAGADAAATAATGCSAACHDDAVQRDGVVEGFQAEAEAVPAPLVASVFRNGVGWIEETAGDENRSLCTGRGDDGAHERLPDSVPATNPVRSASKEHSKPRQVPARRQAAPPQGETSRLSIGVPAQTTTPPRPRSWVETYTPPPPVYNPAAVRSALQRRAAMASNRERALAGQGPVNERTAAVLRSIAGREEIEARLAIPVERARQFLQRRGDVVYRASVDGGPGDAWVVNRRGAQLSDADLFELARSRGFVDGVAIDPAALAAVKAKITERLAPPSPARKVRQQQQTAAVVAAGDRATRCLAILEHAAEEGAPCPGNGPLSDLLNLNSISGPVKIMQGLEARGLIRVERFAVGRVVEIVATGKRTAQPVNTKPHFSIARRAEAHA